jgi:hypothetical protein
MNRNTLTKKTSQIIKPCDLADVLNVKRLNYLHYGKTLDIWSEFLLKEGVLLNDGSQIKRLRSSTPPRSELRRIITNYLRLHKGCTLVDIEQVLEKSIKRRKLFHTLGCRGFSYALDVGMRGYNRQQTAPYHLSDKIDLRIALMSHKQLFYPSCVRRNISRMPWTANHYFRGKAPSIAFCLGKKTNEAWYVLVMQSDLANRRQSCLDEHFRGWRKILFANIIAQAQGRVEALYLIRAEDVLQVCYPGTKEIGHVPKRWMSIYDGTAEQWGMPLVELKKPIDIQIHHHQKPIYARHFYKLSLRQVEVAG